MASYSGLPNPAYWTRRLQDRYQEVDQVEKILKAKYLQVYRTTLSEYVDLLQPFKNADGSYNFKSIEQAVFYNGGFNAKVSRFQGLMDRLDSLITKLGNEETFLMEQAFINSYKDNYYGIIYEMERASGYNLSFTFLTEDRLKQVVHTAWAKDGIEFSDRIWTDKAKLTGNLRKLMEDGIASGENPKHTAQKLKKVTGNSFYNAKRLIITEQTAIYTESDAAAYKEMNFDKYEFLATFDDRTSKVCGNLDGKTFLVSDMQLGVNAPPKHPHCRSTIEPVVAGEYKPPYRFGKNGFGERIRIPSSYTFEEFTKLYGIK